MSGAGHWEEAGACGRRPDLAPETLASLLPRNFLFITASPAARLGTELGWMTLNGLMGVIIWAQAILCSCRHWWPSVGHW